MRRVNARVGVQLAGMVFVVAMAQAVVPDAGAQLGGSPSPSPSRSPSPSPGGASPSPSARPLPLPFGSPTPTPSATRSPSPSPSPTRSPGASPTPGLIPGLGGSSPSPSPTRSPSPSPSPSSTPFQSFESSPLPTATVLGLQLEQLAETGPGDATAGLIGGALLFGAGFFWRAARRRHR